MSGSSEMKSKITSLSLGRYPLSSCSGDSYGAQHASPPDDYPKSGLHSLTFFISLLNKSEN